jgi:hypothetical protein
VDSFELVPNGHPNHRIDVRRLVQELLVVQKIDIAAWGLQPFDLD